VTRAWLASSWTEYYLEDGLDIVGQSWGEGIIQLKDARRHRVTRCWRIALYLRAFSRTHDTLARNAAHLVSLPAFVAARCAHNMYAPPRGSTILSFFAYSLHFARIARGAAAPPLRTRTPVAA